MGLPACRRAMRCHAHGLWYVTCGPSRWDGFRVEIYHPYQPHMRVLLSLFTFRLLTAEQVSHHPPISALHIHNDSLGVTMEGAAQSKKHLSPFLCALVSVGMRVCELAKEFDVTCLLLCVCLSSVCMPRIVCLHMSL